MPDDSHDVIAALAVDLAEARTERDQAVTDLTEALELMALMHDPNASGQYCACGVCDLLARLR